MGNFTSAPQVVHLAHSPEEYCMQNLDDPYALRRRVSLVQQPLKAPSAFNRVRDGHAHYPLVAPSLVRIEHHENLPREFFVDDDGDALLIGCAGTSSNGNLGFKDRIEETFLVVGL